MKRVTNELSEVRRDALSLSPSNESEETIMKTLRTQLTRKLPGTSIFVMAGALYLSAAAPAVALGDEVRYQPVQSITYEFGSKFVNGYFVQEGGSCVVTLMLTEKSDPEETILGSPTRLRMVLQPGQVAGLDSEEAQSLNITCGEDTATLHVDHGAMEQFVARQALAHEKLAAKAQRK